jgi:hypothetical protein
MVGSGGGALSARSSTTVRSQYASTASESFESVLFIGVYEDAIMCLFVTTKSTKKTAANP